jgi:hypothetical protein
MKKITYLILGIMLFSFNYSQAQVQLDTIYIRSKKIAPASTFVEVRYYYYPNLEAYFDTKIALYIYKEHGEWVKSETINASFRGYSLKNGQYVMLKGFTEDNPYTQIEEHKIKYPADYSSRPKPPVKALAAID